MYDRLNVVWDHLGGNRAEPMLQNARRRFLTFTAALTVLIATIWVSLTAGSVAPSRPFLAALCGLVPFVFAPLPYVALRSKVSLDVLSHAYLIALYITVTLTAGSIGGAVSTTSFFLMLLPLLATLLFGIRIGLIWTAVVIATYALLHFARELLPPPAYELLGAAPHDWVRVKEVSFWNACMMTLLALASALSVANFRAIVSRSSALISEATDQTKHARAAQVVAEDLSRSKSDVMANVSHELRTPLNAVIGYSEMLIEGAEDRGAPEDAADNRRVLEAALKLRSMVNDMLKLAALDAGKLMLEKERCSIAEIATEATESLDANVLASRVKIEDQTKPGAWLTDGDKLAMCLHNLLINAAYCSDSEILLRLSHDATARDTLIVEVIDRGPPITNADIHRLFEPFSQPEMSGARYYEGMALKLALTRRMARLLGGELSLCDRVPAAGACFRLTIPAPFSPDGMISTPRVA